MDMNTGKLYSNFIQYDPQKKDPAASVPSHEFSHVAVSIEIVMAAGLSNGKMLMINCIYTCKYTCKTIKGIRL